VAYGAKVLGSDPSGNARWVFGHCGFGSAVVHAAFFVTGHVDAADQRQAAHKAALAFGFPSEWLFPP